VAEADVILKFEIYDGRVPDAGGVALALLAWIDLMKAGADALDPEAELRVGLAGVAEGSDIFKLSLQRVERAAQQVAHGASQYPLVSKAAIALAGVIGTSVVTAAVTNALTPDPRIPEDQMAVFRANRDLLAGSQELQRQQMRFYGILDREPAIESFDVQRPDGATLYSIPRDQFAERSGVWADEAMEDAPATRPVGGTWDVVLIRATMVPEPRRWTFARDGLEFSARMEDRQFLAALRAGTLPITVAEGVRMTIEVAYREEFNGSAWLAVPGSHRVVRVVDPLPPAPAVPLFPTPRTP